MIAFSITPSIEIPIKRGDRTFYITKPMKTLGDRIKERLKELGKSQHWLAAEIGVKQPSINAIINPKHGKSSAGTKHVVAIAEALGVKERWLQLGRGPKLIDEPTVVYSVGHIGAGFKIVRPHEGQVLETSLEPPPGYTECLAARIKGDSMRPLREGWWIFYEQEHAGIPVDCVNQLCAVGLEDNTVLIKVLRKKGGKFKLESWNADDIEDAKVVWASRIIDIRPT